MGALRDNLTLAAPNATGARFRAPLETARSGWSRSTNPAIGRVGLRRRSPGPLTGALPLRFGRRLRRLLASGRRRHNRIGTSSVCARAARHRRQRSRPGGPSSPSARGQHTPPSSRRTPGSPGAYLVEIPGRARDDAHVGIRQVPIRGPFRFGSGRGRIVPGLRMTSVAVVVRSRVKPGMTHTRNRCLSAARLSESLVPAWSPVLIHIPGRNHFGDSIGADSDLPLQIRRSPSIGFEQIVVVLAQ